MNNPKLTALFYDLFLLTGSIAFILFIVWGLQARN